MSNRFNHGSDIPNSSDPKANQKHIKNTDNENTQYISPNSDNEDTAGFSTGFPHNRNVQQTPGRMQYYNPQNEQYNRNNSQYYGQQPYHQQKSPYNGQPMNSGQRQTSNQPNNNNYGNGQYTSTSRYNDQPRGQYYNQPQGSSQRRPQNSQQRPVNSYQGQQRRQSTPNRNSRVQRPVNQSPQRKRPDQPPSPIQQPRRSAPRKSSRRRKPFLFKLISTLMILFLILFAIYSCISIALIKKLNHVETGTRNHTSGAISASYVTSVLLIGTDGRTIDDRGRSDSMILLSINKKTDEITLTSFMRDSHVDIPGYGWEKLNAAYSYGGPELLMDTIEKNFYVRIDDYISVNFNSFASIIDSVGGIEIDVSDAEAQEINTILMAEVNELMGDARDADLLNSGGKMLLNGKQALSYARIRHIGNADFERTERQREVLTQIAGKLKSFKPTMISNIAKNAIPEVTTNMSTSQLYFLSLRLPFFIGYDIEQIQVPADGTYGNVTTSNGGAALSVDFEANHNLIEEEVFGTK